MSKPARLAAAICSATVLFACTIKKAEVVPDAERDTTAISTHEPASKDEKKAKAAGQDLKEQEVVGWLDNPSAVYILDNASEGVTSLPEIARGASGNLPLPMAKQAAPAAPPIRSSQPSARSYRAPEDKSIQENESYRHDQDCYRCPPPPTHRPNSEEYAPSYENSFLTSKENPLSTFSIDVDGAAYSNTRRFIQEGQLPPADAVRIEEFINYFDYNYPQPSGSDPFSITTEIATTPWNPETKLVHIGLQGRRMENEKLPPNNLVFLIDVSGSMATPDKLPLLKNAFNMLIDQLRPQDRISMVVYAGAAGMVLPPTSGSDKETIREALGRLDAGGSTAGGAGLMLAYHAAKQSFIKDGSNRVILATDGDFNVGVSSNDELIRLIEEKRKTGVFLSVLGFGTGNLKDSKMEQIADKGNGNYFYIDNINEGRKVLVEKMTGTLYAIAKDVKLQIEFNPALVKSYRLVGYENRMLAARDFNDDRKDAGELGAGTNVTALYEIVPAVALNRPDIDPLKYQDKGSPRRGWNWGSRNEANGELLTVKFRYKQPSGTTSKLLSRTLRNRDVAWQVASENFRFSAAAAGFGLLLRGSQYSGNLDLDKVADLARGARGRDIAGHRAEFITLVESAKSLSGSGQVGYRQNRSRF
ncbi:MAG: VWA domain-containing protein [Fibrobacterota bacterium]|nr:VWA domain-containing protein [Fibrobacterota bacterium]